MHFSAQKSLYKHHNTGFATHCTENSYTQLAECKEVGLLWKITHMY